MDRDRRADEDRQAVPLIVALRGTSSLYALTALLAGCGGTAAPPAPPAPASRSRDVDSETAHSVSGDRDCDGVADVDDPHVTLAPDRDGDRHGDACDRAPSDP